MPERGTEFLGITLWEEKRLKKKRKGIGRM